MIGIYDFLQASTVVFPASETKVHLACWNGHEHPLDVFFAGRFQAWQEHQSRRNFGCNHVLSLIDIGASRWLFSGVYDVHSSAPHPDHPGNYLYTTSLRPGQDDLIGRVVVSHQRTRQSYVWLKPDVALPLVELRREKMTVGEFPGYNAVTIPHGILRVITEQRIDSWNAALANVKGVYLITDTLSGKLYVGKASGNAGIWQRWCAYAETGHGGNVELKAVLAANGPGHVNHFQYSILEIADTHASDGDILRRESYWMGVLLTRKFGLNGCADKGSGEPIPSAPANAVG